MQSRVAYIWGWEDFCLIFCSLRERILANFDIENPKNAVQELHLG